MNSKRIYILIIIVGAVVALTGVIDLLQGEGFKAIPFAAGFLLIAAGTNFLKKKTPPQDKNKTSTADA